MRLIGRLFRRAGVLPVMSEGFHPKPRMSFPLALAVGIEGRDEIFEFEIQGFRNDGPLSENVDSPAKLFLGRTGREPVRGLVFHEVTDLSPELKKASVRSAVYEITVPESDVSTVRDRLTEILASQSFPMERVNRSPVDLRRSLLYAECRDTTLVMRFSVTPGADAGPRELLAALGMADLEQRGAVLVRTSLELEPATDERRHLSAGMTRDLNPENPGKE